MLTLWATDRTDNRGQTTIGYRLTQVCPRALVSYETLSFQFSSHVIFEAEDFHGSPLHADDADETVASLMGFLTLRPGDTDAQRDFCDAHAEASRAKSRRQFGSHRVLCAGRGAIVKGLDAFLAAYERHLRAAHADTPNHTASQLRSSGLLDAPCAAAIAKGSMNKDSAAFRATCKELGIAHTYKAIASYVKEGCS